MTKLADIEGVGSSYATKLKKAGVRSVEALLKQGADKKGRQGLAKTSGISEKMLLEWVNRADLVRIKGVSTQYADLLECSGVDSVPELAKRVPDSLVKKMHDVNHRKHLVRREPSLSEVSRWVKEAKKLPKIVRH